MILRALWIWQRWIATVLPKVARIAFESAFAPSTMKSRATAGSEPSLDEVVQQRLDGCGVLRRTLDESERMLVAIGVDADGGEQHEVCC